MRLFVVGVLSAVIWSLACCVGHIVSGDLQIVLFGYDMFPELVIVGLAWLVFRSMFGFNSYDAIGLGIGAAFMFWGSQNTTTQNNMATVVAIGLGFFLLQLLLLSKISSPSP